MHPGSSTLHPLLCGGTGTTTNLLLLIFLQNSSSGTRQQSRHVRSAAQVLGRVRLLRRPQAEAAPLTNRREPLATDGPTRAQVRCWGTGAAPTPGCRQGEPAHHFGFL